MWKVIVIMVCIALAGCGNIDRDIAGLTGSPQETCHDGVLYLQFTSGATVKFNQDSTVATCRR